MCKLEEHAGKPFCKSSLLTIHYLARKVFVCLFWLFVFVFVFKSFLDALRLQQDFTVWLLDMTSLQPMETQILLHISQIHVW